MVALPFLVVACTSPEPAGDAGPQGPGPQDDDDDDDSTPGDSSSGTTGHTGDTSVEPPPIDCSLLLPREELTFTTANGIQTEEDFDFDGQGYLITQRSNDLQGIDRSAVSHFVASNVGPDATGIRSTSQGWIAVAQPSDGTVRLVDPSNGGSLVLVSSLSNPNGIEAGADGMIYITENTQNGRVRMVDPVTGDVTVLVQAPWTNGIVLSPDEQTLYFASSSSGYGANSHIVAVERGSDGQWDPSTMAVVYDYPGYVGGLTIDACGNLYGLEFNGRVFRLDTSTMTAEVVLDFGQGGWYSALHFSPGIAGWQLDALYVTNRSVLFEIPTGVPGSHVLTP